ncbi:unnamed protein product [Rhizophagus irregularis]|uniref:Uncharacterized protein n=1 Tax=Rhizophagus irregularis TaxID=588596 RepID=A0A915ZW31_9GLOM|nr:unnamed protein product [Rhizophagus irregularis]
MGRGAAHRPCRRTGGGSARRREAGRGSRHARQIQAERRRDPDADHEHDPGAQQRARHDARARPRRADLRRGCGLFRRRVPRDRRAPGEARPHPLLRRADLRRRHHRDRDRHGRLWPSAGRGNPVRRLYPAGVRPARQRGGAAALSLGGRVLGADHGAIALWRRHLRRADAQPKPGGDLRARHGLEDPALQRSVRRAPRSGAQDLGGRRRCGGARGALYRPARQGGDRARRRGRDGARLRHDGACRRRRDRRERCRCRTDRPAIDRAAGHRHDRRLGHKDRALRDPARGVALRRVRRRAVRAGAGALLLSPARADRTRRRLGHAVPARLRVGLFSGSGAPRQGAHPLRGSLNHGPLPVPPARCRRRRRRGGNRRLAREAGRRDQGRPEPGRCDDRQGDGRHDLPGRRYRDRDPWRDRRDDAGRIGADRTGGRGRRQRRGRGRRADRRAEPVARAGALGNRSPAAARAAAAGTTAPAAAPAGHTPHHQRARQPPDRRRATGRPRHPPACARTRHPASRHADHRPAPQDRPEDAGGQASHPAHRLCRGMRPHRTGIAARRTERAPRR